MYIVNSQSKGTYVYIDVAKIIIYTSDVDRRSSYIQIKYI